MLWSLSNEKTLPACFAKVNKRGVPVTALSVSMLGGVLALFSSVVAARYGVCRAVGDLRFCGGGSVVEHLRLALYVPAAAICSRVRR
ncbi:Lysine-specific permease [Klebsiella pneumoniae]|uniref:Lysine-specific permease n=1 Tax=Klebsiella pneumoniae TaxID=573 RepID=A0A378FNN1_KLEPN|nr:Lysine-specific permease [Klebsiella pneumoniae]